MTPNTRAGATILNVNDHEQTRYLVTRMLSMAGFKVIEAGTGEEALRKAAVAQPDLVVLDIKLPDISGLEVCRMLKSRTNASTFVLQTSATFVTSERKVAGLESGADGYLTHPFEPPELIATIDSLLRLKHAEEALRQRADDLVVADRRKDEFLAMLAHELRNPLAAIAGTVPLLDTARTNDVLFGKLRDILSRQSRHLARLIDDLLDVSRMTRNKIQLKKERCDTRCLVVEATQALKTRLDAKQQTVVLDIQAGLAVDADCTRLSQIFCNLIDNASKYSGKGAEIRLSTSSRSRGGRHFVVLRVEDDGVGIEPHFLPQVFDLFAQADESLERSRGGLGIGLTLVRRLAELHGGHVTAHSDGAGQGSAFEVWLPEVPAPAAVAAAKVTEEAPRRRSILIIEDNVDAAEMLQEFLRSVGHDVDVVHDGLSGVEAAVAGTHDIGIVDIGLPALNGYEVAQRLRADERTKGMSLVALTGYGSPEQHERALAAGFDHHVLKPVDPSNLLRLLAELHPA